MLGRRDARRRKHGQDGYERKTPSGSCHDALSLRSAGGSGLAPNDPSDSSAALASLPCVPVGSYDS
jgi:hypothetical protein